MKVHNTLKSNICFIGDSLKSFKKVRKRLFPDEKISRGIWPEKDIYSNNIKTFTQELKDVLSERNLTELNR